MFKKTKDEEKAKEEFLESKIDLSSPVEETKNEIETIVGPSVEIEGDFSSKGNMVVQGIVAGNVKTIKDLRVEEGAKILASVKAANAKISGEISGNVKIKETLELTASAIVVGDVEASMLIVEGGAVLHGKCSMPGAHVGAGKNAKPTKVTARTRTRQTTPDVDQEIEGATVAA